MTDEPIKPINLSLSPQSAQLIAYMEYLALCQKQFQDYVNKNIGISVDKNGEPAPRENLYLQDQNKKTYE